MRRITRGPRQGGNSAVRDHRIRSIDGSGNNIDQADWGAAETPLLRLTPSAYSDGLSTMSGTERPGARAVSNAVSSQADSRPNAVGASDFVWQWGQFLDHDIDLSDGTNPPESADMLIPIGDIYFDPNSSGTATMPFNRSIYDTASGITSPRNQINEITAWIDASNVYGSDPVRALALRSNDGSGRLETSDGNLLPFNVDGLANAGGPGAEFFLAGDVRANEQIGLTAMHTLFVREHNRIADRFAADNPSASGDKIYQHARRIVGALMQKITYRDYLPILLGENALAPYRGYDDSINGSIANEFSTAAYRYGHSALSPQLLRFDADGNEISEGHLPLRNAFFSPHILQSQGQFEAILRGLAAQQQQSIDVYVIDDVRNFLFGEPGDGGFDLVALNIQRGRDHGHSDYNSMRSALGLSSVQSFSDISSDPEIQARLANAYGSVELVDPWIGGLAEDHLQGKMVGELVYVIMKQQFEALRDGDRFWYSRSLPRRLVDKINNTSLADIIRRNSEIGDEIVDNVFIVGGTSELSDGGRQQRN